MKATTFVQALARCKYDTIPTQVMQLSDRSDLVKITGENGRIYSIGANGIPESMYLYLYVDTPEQKDFFDTLTEAARRYEGSPNFVDACVCDGMGQTIAVINILEA